MEKAGKNMAISYKKKNWNQKKKKLENFSWTHGRAEVTGQASNTKSGERQAPAGRTENQSQAPAYLGQTLPSTTLADKKI